jgi:hypothetical protein
VGEHEKLIYSLESKAKRLETENQQMSQKTDFEIGSLRSTTQAEIDSLGQQCSKYKAELNDLAEFAEKKVLRMTRFARQQAKSVLLNIRVKPRESYSSSRRL